LLSGVEQSPSEMHPTVATLLKTLQKQWGRVVARNLIDCQPESQIECAMFYSHVRSLSQPIYKLRVIIIMREREREREIEFCQKMN
jgi:hypothetical protein